MRLFLFNPKTAFSSKDIARRAKLGDSAVRRELLVLKKSGLITGKVFTRTVEQTKENKKVLRKKREDGWILKKGFPYLSQFQQLLIYTVLIKNEEIVRKLNFAGKIKLVVVAGVFIRDFDSRVDILVVGDRIKDKVLENIIKDIEAEIGKELSFAVFATDDFKYRLGMYDKLIRDILDYPHKTLLDKIGLNEKRI
ncbi:MAG: hypothetical protein Q8P86_03095 [bacterium]|nr:hypothetical protein [bacterium]